MKLELLMVKHQWTIQPSMTGSFSLAKEKKVNPKKTGWRRYYRRFRIYLPLAILLLFLMVIFLPIRGTWISNFLEKQIEKRADVDVEITSVRVHLWTGNITLDDISVQANNSDAEPMRLDRLELEGSFGELMSGDGDYPQRVTLTKPSDMTIVRNENQIGLRGPLYDLITALQGDEPRDESDPVIPLPPNTPEIILNDFSISIDDQVEDKRHEFFVSNFTFDQRRGYQVPLNAYLDGMVTSGSMENFSLDFNYLIEEQLGHVRFDVDEINYSKTVEDITYEANARNLNLKVDINHSDISNIIVSSSLVSDYLEISDTALGGVEFFERDFNLNTDSTFDADAQYMKDWSLRVSSPKLRIDGEGTFEDSDQPIGEANLAIRKLPPVTFQLLNQWGQENDLFFERATTSTINIDLSAAGNFTTPEELDLDGSVMLRGWNIQSGDLPSPISITRLELQASQDVITLHDLDLRYENLRSSFAGIVENWNSDTPKVNMNLDLDGNGQGLLAIAKQQNLIGSEVQEIDLPLQTSIETNILFRNNPLRLRENEMVQVDWFSDETNINGSISWQDGFIDLSQLVYPINLIGGRLSFSDTSANLGYIQVQYNDLLLDGNFDLNSPYGKWNFNTEISANLNVETTVEQVLNIARQEVGQVLTPFDITGNSDTSVSISGKLLSPKNWKYTLSSTFTDLQTSIPIRYADLNISDGFMTINLADDKIDVPEYSLTLNDRINVSGNMTADNQAITSNIKIGGEAEALSGIIRKELKEMVLEGEFTSSGTLKLTAQNELIEAPSLLESWIRSVISESNKTKNFIHIKDESPFKLEAEGQIFPVANVGVFHRDMPQPVRNIRGGIGYDETGFQFNDVLVDVGDAKDLRVNGFAQMGHVSGPVIVRFDVEGDEINFNNFKSGWKEREWAPRPFMEPDFGEKDNRPEKNVTQLYVNVDLNRSQFLSVEATDVKAALEFNAWRFKRNTVDVSLTEANVYEGTLTGEATLEFPKKDEEDRRALFSTQLRPRQTEMRLFLNDLRETEHKVRGLVTGTANIEGRIGDYPSWTGNAEFRVTNSRFIGEQSFRFLTRALNLGQVETPPETIITGTCIMEDEVIRFPEMEIESEDILMFTSGSIDHDGYIDFIVTVDLFRDQLDRIPVIGNINRFINELQKNLVSYRVTGKMLNPQISTIPLATTDLDFFREGRRRYLDENN